MTYSSMEIRGIEHLVTEEDGGQKLVLRRRGNGSFVEVPIRFPDLNTTFRVGVDAGRPFIDVSSKLGIDPAGRSYMDYDGDVAVDVTPGDEAFLDFDQTTGKPFFQRIVSL